MADFCSRLRKLRAENELTQTEKYFCLIKKIMNNL